MAQALNRDRPRPTETDPWETAYAHFETPAQEIRKFTRRLAKLGAAQWPRDADIVELFCGRGNGLHALSNLGFTKVEGVDLSPSLAAQYKGPATLHVSDCRQLPFATRSKDIVIVQGGLHHLKRLPQDLEQTLAEISRVLREHGRLAVVEPWLTPFLAMVHGVCRIKIVRRVVPKIDAFATMVELEGGIYTRWLAQPEAIRRLFNRFFHEEFHLIGWGKCFYVGRNQARAGGKE